LAAQDVHWARAGLRRRVIVLWKDYYPIKEKRRSPWMGKFLFLDFPMILASDFFRGVRPSQCLPSLAGVLVILWAIGQLDKAAVYPSDISSKVF
jgi:hypothetical protein